MDIEARLSRLERAAARWRIAAIVLGAVCVSSGLMGVQSQPSTTTPRSVVITERLAIGRPGERPVLDVGIDANGHCDFRMGSSDRTLLSFSVDQQTKNPCVSLTNSRGRLLLLASEGKDGTGTVNSMDGNSDDGQSTASPFVTSKMLLEIENAR